MAVETASRVNWKPNGLIYQLFGGEGGILFPTARLLDDANRTKSLLEDPNPFALVTAAHLFTRRPKGDPVLSRLG